MYITACTLCHFLGPGVPRETCGVCELGVDGRRESRDEGVFTVYTVKIPGTGVRYSYLAV